MRWKAPSGRAEWCSLTLYACMRKVPSRNLGQDIGVTDWRFSWFTSVPAGNCWYGTSDFENEAAVLGKGQLVSFVWHCPCLFYHDSRTLCGESRCGDQLSSYSFDLAQVEFFCFLQRKPLSKEEDFRTSRKSRRTCFHVWEYRSAGKMQKK